MDVFMYQAGLYCEECGLAIRERLTTEGKAPADPDDESSYDSDDFPKGPYPDGGGEADVPQHCDAGDGCINAVDVDNASGIKVGVFLENPLTSEGTEYVRTRVQEHADTGTGNSAVIGEWTEFYDIHPEYNTTSGEFTLTIRLGNDAMCSPDHVAEALRRVANKLEGEDEFTVDAGGNIMDENGNSVGSWQVEDDDA